MKGYLKITVERVGKEIYQSPWQSNLINNKFCNINFNTSLYAAYLSDKTTKNISTIAASLSQTGQTVTATGNYTFTSADLYNTLQYADGTRARIVEITNTKSVKTFESTEQINQTDVKLWQTRSLTYPPGTRIGSGNEKYLKLNTSNGGKTSYNTLPYDKDTNNITREYYYQFQPAPETLTVNSIVLAASNGLDNTYSSGSYDVHNNAASRIVLEQPIQVLTGDVVRIYYRLTLNRSHFGPQSKQIADLIKGYPYPYDINNIAIQQEGQQYAVTVTTNKPHHFAVGDHVRLKGATPKPQNNQVVAPPSQYINDTFYLVETVSEDSFSFKINYQIPPSEGGKCHSRGEVIVQWNGTRSNSFVYDPLRFNKVTFYEQENIRDPLTEIPIYGSLIGSPTGNASALDITITTGTRQQAESANNCVEAAEYIVPPNGNVNRIKQMRLRYGEYYNMFITFTDPQPKPEGSFFTLNPGYQNLQTLS